MKQNTKSMAALFALASVGAMNDFFQQFSFRLPKGAGKRRRGYNSPHDGARQAERQRRQGLHMASINGFYLMQTRPSKDRSL